MTCCLSRTTWVPVSLLSFSTAHSPGLLLSGCTDKAGHILTLVGPCSSLSRLNAVQDAAVPKMLRLTDNGLADTWLKNNKADNGTILPSPHAVSSCVFKEFFEKKSYHLKTNINDGKMSVK